jgi:hypothetical protein
MILPGSYANGFSPRDGQPLYPELWRGCVGAWAPCLGPTGLTLRDNSRFGNHGTLTNMDAGADWVTDAGRYALDFDGTNDEVLIGANTLLQFTHVQPFTLSAWFRPDNVANLMPIGYTTTTNSAGYYLSWTRDAVSDIPANCVNCDYFNGTAFQGRIGTAGSVVAGQLVHVAMTRDGSGTQTGHRVYLNGINLPNARASVAATLTASIDYSSAFFAIGRRYRTTPIYADMTFVESMVHGRELNSAEIQLLATRRGIAYEMAPRRRSRAVVITSGFSALRPSILRGSR